MNRDRRTLRRLERARRRGRFEALTEAWRSSRSLAEADAAERDLARLAAEVCREELRPYVLSETEILGDAWALRFAVSRGRR